MTTVWKLPAFEVLAVFLLLSVIISCATPRPAPVAPAAPPGEAEALVASLTDWLKLDAAQQATTLKLARELVARNQAIRAGWDRGERVRPEVLLASRGTFLRDFLAILTDEQKEQYNKDSARLLSGGRFGR